MSESPALLYSDAELVGILSKTKTVAVVGLSAKEDRPSFEVAQYLQNKGYRIVPVNPGLAGRKILGEAVYATLQDIPFPIDMVDVFRASNYVAGIVDEAILVGAKTVWMQLDIRNDEAAAKAQAAGLSVVMDRCPLIELNRLGQAVSAAAKSS